MLIWTTMSIAFASYILTSWCLAIRPSTVRMRRRYLNKKEVVLSMSIDCFGDHDVWIGFVHFGELVQRRLCSMNIFFVIIKYWHHHQIPSILLFLLLHDHLLSSFFGMTVQIDHCISISNITAQCTPWDDTFFFLMLLDPTRQTFKPGRFPS